MEQKPGRAKYVLGSLFFLAVLVGEACLTKKQFPALWSSPVRPAVRVELVAMCTILILIVVGIAGRGYHSKKLCATVLILYTVYAVYNIIRYKFYIELYAGGFERPLKSYGPALECAKLVLIFMGIVANIPMVQKFTGEEYADHFVTIMERQKVEWAKAGAKNANNEFKEAARKLKSELSEEEYDEMLKNL